jgi:putative ATPase
MEELGYGKGYEYNPKFKGPVDQSYLPTELQDRRYLETDN